MTPEQIQELLVGDEHLTYENIGEDLSSRNDSFDKNATLFCPDDNGNLMPICNNPIPIRTTLAERSWLYYYLQKPEAKLFSDEDIINILMKNLAQNTKDYPLNDNTFTIKEINTEKEKQYSSYNVLCFRSTLKRCTKSDTLLQIITHQTGLRIKIKSLFRLDLNTTDRLTIYMSPYMILLKKEVLS